MFDEETAYLERLAQERTRLKEGRLSSLLGSGDESEDDDDVEEELGYISAIDHVDPYIAFKAALTGAFPWLFFFFFFVFRESSKD